MQVAQEVTHIHSIAPASLLQAQSLRATLSPKCGPCCWAALACHCNTRARIPRPALSPHAGAISESQVITQVWALLLGGIGVAAVLDTWAGHDWPIMTVLAIFGSFISYIYSAPPLKLKQSGWAGNYALGSSYIALPWWAGQVRGKDVCLFVLGTGVISWWAGLVRGSG